MAYLDSIHITRTYGGCLAGCPSVDLVIESAKNKVKKLFGDGRPILVLDYEAKPAGIDFDGNERYMLPEYEHIAWISSYTPIEDGDGSQLFVIWYANSPSCDITPILEKFDWDTHAKDWWM